MLNHPVSVVIRVEYQALRARRLRTALLAAPERTDQRLRGVEDATRAYAAVEMAHAGAARAGSAFARRAAAFRSGAERASVPDVSLEQVLGPNNAVEIPTAQPTEIPSAQPTA